MARAGDGSGAIRPEGQPRVLIIEDEVGIRDFLERGLRAEGFAIEAEGDGLAGEQRALGESFDLLVLDLMLPRRGGLEILASLQQHKPLLPVILLTARGELGDRVGGLDAGAVDYLVKPFALAELAARIRAQLRLAGQSPATSTLRGADIELDLLTRQVRRGAEQGAPVEHRVRAARVSAAPSRPCAHARGDPRERLGLRARSEHERRRRLHRLPAPQAGQARPPGADLDDPLGRISPGR